MKKSYAGKIPNSGAAKVEAISGVQSKRGRKVKHIGKDLRCGK